MPSKETSDLDKTTPHSTLRDGDVVEAEGVDEAMPQRLGEYRIERKLGGGGMGTVYLARDQHLDRMVALKVPKANVIAHAEGRAAFLEEARIASRFEGDPGFCRIYNYGEGGGIPYLAMQFIDGPSLADFHQIGRPVRHAVEIVMGLARTLRDYHDGGWIHRDLKPDNVRLSADGQPVLIDFGLAVRLSSAGVRLPGPGELVGTPCYMAPEQIVPGEHVLSAATDIYALGAILYELAAGRRPFEAETMAELTEQILAHEPEPLTIEPLNAICRRAMAKDPADRYANVTEFFEDLAAFLLDQAPPAAAPRATRRRRLLEPANVRFSFIGPGELAPPDLEGRNRLFLDVGNGLRPGVIDHHQLQSCRRCAASILVNRLDLVDAALAPEADRLTIVLHRWPDLDCLVSAYIARCYVTTGKLPDRAEKLIDYVDRIDAGYSHITDDRPFTLYAAYMRLLNRPSPELDVTRWTRALEEGFRLLDYVIAKVHERRDLFKDATSVEAIDAVDAFAAPRLFDAADRAFLQSDRERYEAIFSNGRTVARVAPVWLPSQFGSRRKFSALLVRDLPDVNEPGHVQHFKDWARFDRVRSLKHDGFTALSVFSPTKSGRPRRCILSVTPWSEASLRGLGERLEKKETERRTQIYGGVDDRVENALGERLAKRPNYDNADPWYDGRAHNYTIVDAPRGGTVLTDEEIEAIFLDYAARE